MNIKDYIKDLEEVIDQVKVDVEKFDTKGNKAAGTRVRKAMQEIKTIAQNVRLAIRDKNQADKEARG